MKLTKWEITFLRYYQNEFNAKWMRVFYNKHPLLATRVDLYTIYKRKIKKEPVTGQMTYISMFNSLKEGQWYFIPELLNQKGGDHRNWES